MNPQVPSMFTIEHDRISNIVFESYESWIVQDQAFFTSLDSLISKGVLLHVLFYKHAFEVWDKVDKHYNSHMKDRVHPLR